MVAVINTSYPIVLVLLILHFFGESNSRNVREVQSQPRPRVQTDERVSPSTIRFISRSDGRETSFVTPNSLPLRNTANPAKILPLQSIEDVSQQPSPDQCPPLPTNYKPQLCQMERCNSSADCRRNATSSNDRICCFNGCVMTCTHKVDAPIAFDWVEETEFKASLRTGLNDSFSNLYPHQSSTSSSSSSEDTADDYEYEDENGLPTAHKTSVNHERLSTTMFAQDRQPQLPRRLEPRTLMSSKSSPDLVVLPGGCLLRRRQYQDIIQFRRNNHVNACLCVNGDVVCEVNIAK